jgi:hypothetical protein
MTRKFTENGIVDMVRPESIEDSYGLFEFSITEALPSDGTSGVISSAGDVFHLVSYMIACIEYIQENNVEISSNSAKKAEELINECVDKGIVQVMGLH